MIHQTLIETSQMVGSGRYLMIQSAAAAVQVVVVVAAFSLAMMASGAGVSEPVTTASMVPRGVRVWPRSCCRQPWPRDLLPPAAWSYRTSAPTVRGTLAYATVYWVVAHLPAVSMGLPALFARR